MKILRKLIQPSIIISLLSYCVAAYSTDIWTEKSITKLKEIPYPDAEPLKQAYSGFIKTFQGEDTQQIWNALKMETITLDDGSIIIREQESAKQGRGFFWFNPNSKAKNWLLQAPHADSDLYTGKITDKLLKQSQIRGACWNTVKRSTPFSNGQVKADLAHLNQSYWQSFTKAFAEQFPDGRIIQLHGFAQSKRRSSSAKKSDLIISAGQANPPEWVKQTSHCLKQNLPVQVRLYRQDVNELGGTTNAQGQLLRQLGHQGFLHVEMSKSLRKLFLSNSDLRSQFLSCIHNDQAE